MIRPLSHQQSMEMLRKGTLGRLGCVSDGEPYVVPVNYICDGDSVVIHSLPGRKVEAMRSNRRACLQVDEVDGGFGWRSAIAFGTYEEITDRDERSRALQSLLSKFPQLTPVESFIVEDACAPEPIVFRIKIDRMTGVGETW